jgi:transcriptional regulator with XRE-family HTH domain
MPDDTSTRLAGNIKRLREQAGLSQKALAEQSGVPRPTIAHLESGQANPTLSVVLKVAGSLGVSVDGLVDPGEAPVVVLSPRTLPTERTSRLRRVKLLAGHTLRDPEVERITVKAGGRVHLKATSQSPVVVVCEKGEFSVLAGPVEEALVPEKVAYVRADADCHSPIGGVIYLIQGR